MNELRTDVAINRVLLTNPALDSGAIAVRGTVFHVFGEAGDHDVAILRDGRVAGRFTVAVQPEGAVPQVNVDLAGLAADADRSGNITAHYAVREGGVMGFHADQGIGRYAVVISHTAGGGSRTVLDSRGQLPAGDLFAATLITPRDLPRDQPHHPGTAADHGGHARAGRALPPGAADPGPGR